MGSKNSVQAGVKGVRNEKCIGWLRLVRTEPYRGNMLYSDDDGSYWKPVNLLIRSYDCKWLKSLIYALIYLKIYIFAVVHRHFK